MVDPGTFELIVPDILDGFEGQRLQVQPLGQPAEDLPVGAGVEAGFERPLPDEEIGLQPILAGEDALPFQIRRSGSTTSENHAVSDQLKVTETSRSSFSKTSSAPPDRESP